MYLLSTVRAPGSDANDWLLQTYIYNLEVGWAGGARRLTSHLLVWK